VNRRATKVVRKVAGYELLTRLGEGGSGTVFKSRQPGLDRIVALKLLSPELAGNQEYIARFRNEARAAARIDHPNVVQVLAAGYDGGLGVPYIVYEFVDGMTLTDMLEERGRLPEREALAVIRAMSEALDCLAAAGLVHRDVKPDNILVSRDGVPKLADLGLAKEESWEQITMTGIVMGTPDYMAPEQATGERSLDLATDIYALGLTLYVMLTGRLPYDGETPVEILTAHIQEDCPDPRIVAPGISAEAVRLLQEMTQRKQTRRYQSAAAVIRDVDLIVSGKPIRGAKARASSRIGRARPSKRRRPLSRRERSGDELRSSSEMRFSSSALREEPELSEDELRDTSIARRRDASAGNFAVYYLLAFLVGAVMALVVFGLPRI